MEKQSNFPRTLKEAIEYFKDPDNSLNFMVALRWSDGVTCPYCESKRVSFLKSRRIWKCLDCRKQFSVKVGTIFEDSPISLDKWLCALWLKANSKNGISSYEISRDLGVTQKTAWFMTHRINCAMQTKTFAKLSGEVEADETFVGGKARFMHKERRDRVIASPTGYTGKIPVLGIIQRDGEVLTRVIPNTKRYSIQPVIRENVEKGSQLFTDTSRSYIGLSGDYDHQTVDHMAKEYVRGKVHTNSLENFWSLWKRCIKGTHIHLSEKHMSRYLDEETFRYSNRTLNDAGRFLLTAQAVIGRRLTWEKLTGART